MTRRRTTPSKPLLTRACLSVMMIQLCKERTGATAWMGESHEEYAKKERLYRRMDADAQDADVSGRVRDVFYRHGRGKPADSARFAYQRRYAADVFCDGRAVSFDLRRLQCRHAKAASGRCIDRAGCAADGLRDVSAVADHERQQGQLFPPDALWIGVLASDYRHGTSELDRLFLCIRGNEAVFSFESAVQKHHYYHCRRG